MTERDRSKWTDRVDWNHVPRGASTGFTVLVIGGLVQPLVSLALPPLGVVWLIVVAVAAFAIAGRRIGDASSPPLHGAVAALASYFLVVPLVYLATRSVDLQQIVLTSAVALVVGAAAGHLAGHGRSSRPV